EETVAVSSEEFARKTRIACQAFNVHRLLWPQIRRLDLLTIYKYGSHKLLRWLGIYSLIGALALAMIGAAVAGWWLTFLALTLSPTLLWALGSHWAIPPFAQCHDIVGAFMGAGIGVWKSLRGERYQTWSPAASLRSHAGS